MEEVQHSVAGLAAPVRILVDPWGIAHIRAASFLDMFAGQGFNAARDRLWQMDLWRRRGLGLLAQDLGPAYVRHDRAARRFLFRGDIEAEWSRYAPDAKAICEHFVAGVNAYIDAVEADPALLPVEFGALDYRPLRWAAEDILRIRSHGVIRNASSELARTIVAGACGKDADLVRQDLQPPHDAFADHPALFDWMGPEILEELLLATAPLAFDTDGLALPPSQEVPATALAAADAASLAQGSNNWAVSAPRTATGRPILAGDPHRAPCTPALRHIVHLASPGFDAIGAGEPIMPGIAMGHNGTAAFGLTLFFGHDQEDLYVYELHPEDAGLYRYGEGWEAFRAIEEAIGVRGAEASEAELLFTRHGPVLWIDREARRAVALRTLWLEPGAVPYLRSLSMMRSTSFAEFRDNLAGWALPSVNQVYADVAGDIGWVVAGADPVRPNWDGLLPVPGDGRFEWAGFADPARLPMCFNPAEGFIATANEMNLPETWLAENKATGWEWANDSRARRVKAVLAEQDAHSLADSRALQLDLLSLPAGSICGLLGDLPDPACEDARAARTLLLGWDHRVRADSEAAALFQIWLSEYLRPAIIGEHIQDPASLRVTGPGSLHAIEALLLAGRGSAAQAALFERTLGEAWRYCAEKWGASSADWSWGALHQARFVHPLASPHRPSLFDIPPIALGGDETTPFNARYTAGNFEVIVHANFRMVIDVGNWDASVCINSPGQSGDPRSPHYSDLAAPWVAGDYVPMLYSQQAVDEVAVRTIHLRPAAAASAA